MKLIAKNTFMLALSVVALLSACTKTEGTGPTVAKYTSPKGTTINLTTSNWYVTRFTTGGGGAVNLKLEGTTNADKIILKTHGDGLISDNELPLTTGKKFSTDAGISFTATSVPAGNFTASTQLIAYKGSDVFVVDLVSGELHY
ncbi:hypothetical protein [Mucilaginibacter psychrotolerans]|uniref:Uncharacterized protein n=1 Tax=Mucilaginibacter psychrotolerans TaxID=1524096 RepID=A0A4Y8S509_9SPHI|nr:hypothetical protein [Mucilaginibacter psychrotolerans]TFF33816.1 hypothetical protein E2R66_24095 [Mucilaginibacter psychrotolerans]